MAEQMSTTEDGEENPAPPATGGEGNEDVGVTPPEEPTPPVEGEPPPPPPAPEPEPGPPEENYPPPEGPA